MKKLLSLLLVGTFCMVCSVPSFAAQAASPQVSETVISVTEQDLGNGFTEKTVTSIPGHSMLQTQLNAASLTKTVHRTAEVRHDGSFVGSVTLTATFGYNGSSSWVNSMRASHSMASGWDYTNEKLWKSGGTANLSATMVKKLAFLTVAQVDPSVSMTCSPTGAIS